MVQAGAVQAGYFACHWSPTYSMYTTPKSGFIHIIVLSEDLSPHKKSDTFNHLQFSWTIGTVQKNLVKQAESWSVKLSFLQWLLNSRKHFYEYCRYPCNRALTSTDMWTLCALRDLSDPTTLASHSCHPPNPAAVDQKLAKSRTNWGPVILVALPSCSNGWHHTRYQVSYIRKMKK